jgi:hypothetical protein
MFTLVNTILPMWFPETASQANHRRERVWDTAYAVSLDHRMTQERGLLEWATAARAWMITKGVPADRLEATPAGIRARLAIPWPEPMLDRDVDTALLTSDQDMIRCVTDYAMMRTAGATAAAMTPSVRTR